ncbi:protein-L-isoaspartate O-methyltransferase family protein [Actinomycetospora soli]|uniref:protein-L-isoaspartate O-methyltransferase family protein n=1 Tax=Actinomycetospora soli TaxID=2893887 RepID=UPI001E5C23DE|nr:methyltransferase domain-containing protein [Actinomycetospora soli]MCD2187681.1 protein-L-isoaspartate O-methyltransferase [Actinomycetospora soli]
MRPRADVATAFARTDPAHYQRTADGSRYPASTRPDVVLAMLRLLDLPRGATVLEIGTGSGFATAVLSRAVGPEGLVRSVDVDPAVTARARRLLAADGRTNTRLSTADALRQPGPDEPVDRLVAFLSVTAEVPAPWTAAVRPGGLLVVPFRGTGRVVAHRRDPVDGAPHPGRSLDARFDDPGDASRSPGR